MSWHEFQSADSPRVMAEAIGSTASLYLGGGDNLKSIAVEYFDSAHRAIVWADLIDPSLDSQLNAVSAFTEVRDCYVDEVDLELRFGDPHLAAVGRPFAARAVVTSR